MSDTIGYFVEHQWTRRERFMFWLWPKNYKALPKAPRSHKDVLTVRTVCVLGFIDRLRILVSGRLFVESRTVCENEVGQMATAVTMFVLKPGAME